MAQHKTARKASGKHVRSTRATKKAAASRPNRSGPTKRGGSALAVPPSDEEISLDRRRNAERRGEARASSGIASETMPQLERRKKVNRRRQIDPTTCERDYTDEEVEFMNALDDYKRRSGRMFPTCSEVLEVVRGLGYVKMLAVELESHRGTSASAVSAKPMPIDWPALTSTNQAGSDDCLAVDCEAQMAY